MDPFSELSVKSKIVDRVLPANLWFFFFFTFDVFMTICIGLFFKMKFLLVPVGFICMKDITDTVGNLFDIVYCLSVALTAVKIRTVLLKT